MSFLPIIILIFFLLKNSSLSEVFNNIDVDGIKSTLSQLGIENDFLNGISNETISSLLSGDIKSLLPLLPSLLSMFNKPTNNYSDLTKTDFYSSEDLTPIKDIAGEQILSTLGNYFK